VAHPTYLREKARELRQQRGLTIDEIVDRLSLPRSTIYYWVRDLPIARKPATTWPESARRRGNLAMQRKYRLLREAAYEEGRASFHELCLEPDFRDFVCLYIAEGYKRDRNSVSLGNSDPAVVKLAHRWIKRFSRNPLGYSVQYHRDQSLSTLQLFWGRELGISPDAVRMQRKSNSSALRGRTWRCKYGVMEVRCGDTLFRARLEAWMDLVRASWA
jgi:transcriptional regulator with XRE-family HTH domain